MFYLKKQISEAAYRWYLHNNVENKVRHKGNLSFVTHNTPLFLAASQRGFGGKHSFSFLMHENIKEIKDVQFLKIIPANESIRIFVAGELLSCRLVPPAQPHQAFPLVELQPVKDGSAISVSKSDRFYVSHSLSLTHTLSLSLSI